MTKGIPRRTNILMVEDNPADAFLTRGIICGMPVELFSFGFSFQMRASGRK